MTTVARSRGYDRAEPVYFVEIALLNSGPVLYLSDRNVTVSGQAYEDYLSDLSGLGDSLERATSGGLNADITLGFRNERFRSYSYLIEIGETYPLIGAACTIRECYLDASGAPSDTETAFKGVLDEPCDITLFGFSCGVSSAEFRADLTTS